MATVTLSSANFAEVIGRDGIVLVDFWADWCGPCRAFAPVYEQASEEHPDIVFGMVDTEAEVDLAAEFEIRSIPTVMAVRDGIIVYAQPGALPPQALESLITQVRAKSIINRVPSASRVPFEWTVNPYRGCSHACVYCLAGDTPVLMADGRTRPLAELRV